MELVTGIKLRDIFIDNGNWWKLFLKKRSLIRMSIITNVLKMLVCRTTFLGYHIFTCPRCKKSIKAPHTCKSRFCSSCGKKATDIWMKTNYPLLPHTTWQHITFTMPDKLWIFFRVNRKLLNVIPALAAGIILKLAKQNNFRPGIYLAIHTFGRDLKHNVHLHLATTIGGLSLKDNTWTKGAYIHHDTLKKMWRYEIVRLLQNEFKNGNLKMPPELKHIKTYSAFCSWMTHLYKKTWVVHLNEQSRNMKVNVQYLGRYLKRPPIGETRIKKYDGKNVTFEFLDHYTDTMQSMTLPVLDFLQRLIVHIPDKNFRCIRYYGFLSNRLRGTLLPIVRKELNMIKAAALRFYITWRSMIRDTFDRDPIKCPKCGCLMELSKIIKPAAAPIRCFHKEIAHGYFPLLQ